MQLEDEKLQKEMPSLLIHSDSKNGLHEIQASDSTSSKSSDKEVTLCPNSCNVITKDQSWEKLLFEIIEKIEDPKIKAQYLRRLKILLLKDKKI